MPVETKMHAFEKQNKSKLNLEISNGIFGLSDKIVNALERQHINSPSGLYSMKYTNNKLREKCHVIDHDGPSIDVIVNRALGACNLPPLSEVEPVGAIYSFQEKQKRDLINSEVNDKAVEIMMYVNWGFISPHEMAKELNYPGRKIIMTYSDINKIIKDSIALLETA
jgi:hypothetical protein